MDSWLNLEAKPPQPLEWPEAIQQSPPSQNGAFFCTQIRPLTCRAPNTKNTDTKTPTARLTRHALLSRLVPFRMPSPFQRGLATLRSADRERRVHPLARKASRGHGSFGRRRFPQTALYELPLQAALQSPAFSRPRLVGRTTIVDVCLPTTAPATSETMPTSRSAPPKANRLTAIITPGRVVSQLAGALAPDA